MFDENKFIKENENLYQKNLLAFKTYYPFYLSKIRNQKLFENYHLMPTGTRGEVNVYSVKNDIFIYDVKNPFSGIKNDFDKVEGNLKQFLILYGIGLSYELDYMLKNVIDKDFKGLVVIEKDIELFKLSMYIFDYAKLFGEKKVIFLLDETVEEVFTEFYQYITADNTALYRIISTVKHFYCTRTVFLHQDYYLSIINKINEAINLIKLNFGTSPIDSMIGLNNMLLNMEEIIENPGINLLYEKFKGRPAVIVSTGPSLNKNKHLLKEIQDKALIICPEASLKILIEMGVKPHIITSLERVKEVVPLVEGFSEEEVKDVYLAACPVVVKEVYEAYKGPRLIVYRNFNHFLWTEIERGNLSIKSSAGNMAYKIADALGCAPIVLIGQDLAYTRDGRSHAKGAFYGETDYIDRFEGGVEIMGNDGKMLPTNKYLKMFKQQYEVDIAESDAKCINATEGGAYIAGTEVMSFREAIDKYIQKSFNPLSIIKDNISQFSNENAEKDKAKFVEICEDTLKDLDDYKKISVEAIDYINSVSDDIENSLKNRKFDKKKIKRIANKIISEYKDKIEGSKNYELILHHTVGTVIIRLYNNIAAGYDQCEDESEARIYEIFELKRWFQNIIQYSEATEMVIENTYKRLKSE